MFDPTEKAWRPREGETLKAASERFAQRGKSLGGFLVGIAAVAAIAIAISYGRSIFGL